MIPLLTDDVPEEVAKVVRALHTLEEWPQDWSKDVALVHRLMGVYPNIDMTAEALHFVTWFGEWREKHPRKEVKLRARFVNWMKNAGRFEKRRAKPPANKESHRGTGLSGWNR